MRETRSSGSAGGLGRKAQPYPESTPDSSRICFCMAAVGIVITW